jgi:3-oxoacyl-[acyl-carrier protein] reductase
MAEFSNRVALVTGGSRGIGRACALRLAREGADVAVNYVSHAAEAKAVVAEIQGMGRRAIEVPCNVAKPAEVDRMVATTREKLGPIDLVVHSAGISVLLDHNELTFDRWKEMIDVHLHGAFLVIFAVKDEMIKRRYGRIVTISSVAALRPRKMQIHYASAKAGVIALTRCCAEAFAPAGVRVNGIAPGLIKTDMAKVLSDDLTRKIIADTPLGRLGTPEDIAGVARFLLSDDSGFMTGDTLSVSGGRVPLP